MQRTALMILALLLPAPAPATVGPAPMACHDCVEEKDPPPPANNATFVAQVVPAAMVAGSTVTARVQMRNTGTTVWSHAAQYRLGAHNPVDNTTWGLARVNLPADIAPGQTATFDFAIKAPATTGTRNFQWRMVRDGVAWFGVISPNVAVTVASGTLTAAPSPCSIPWGGTTCAATVQWSSSAANAEVWVTNLAGANPTLFARAQNGSASATWITANGARFHLEAGGWSALTLATRDVRGEPTVNQAPSVSLTSPTGGSKALVGDSLTLGAWAADADDGVARVEFLVDGVEVGEDAHAPYEHAWTPTQARSYALSARVVDTRGEQRTSALVHLVAAPKVTVTRRYTYNAHQDLCRVDEPETGASFHGYDAAGNLAWSASGFTATEGTGCGLATDVAARRIDRTYDQRNRLRTVRYPDGRGDLDHAYAPDGVLSGLVVDNGDGRVVTTSYAYNARRLLTRETVSHGEIHWPIDHAYDANGHLSAQSWDGLTVSYAPNGIGQPTRAGTFATGVRYHPNGAIQQFTYGNGVVHTLSQNARQLPDTSVDAYGGTAFLSDAYDYDATGNVAAITDGATGRNQPDALGTPVVVTDEARNVVERSEYEPYGKVLNRALHDAPGYTGHVEDKATGLTYAQQRYLDTDVPQFVSVDEMTAYASGDWRLFNRYAYAYNNPYKFTDPDGRLPIFIPIVAGITWMLTSGDAHAPAPGQPTGSMSAGEALGSFADAVPAGKAGMAAKMAVDVAEGAAGGGRAGKGHTQAAKRVAREQNQAANGGKCPKCGVQMTDPQQSKRGQVPDQRQAEGDHVIPKSQGGDGATVKDMRNIETICRQCNLDKSNKVE